jgi:ligand-binding SRPBCC domain-containing protein
VDGWYSFTFATPLTVPAARVWDHASTFAGVNRELWPLVRMTYPPRLARLTPQTVPLGRRVFRSWILLFGLIPVDFDDITLQELEPGRGFYEVSRMLGLREWRHRRTIEPTPDGCTVRDDIEFQPLWGPAGPLLAWIYQRTFELRHRRLRRLFGRCPSRR